MIDNAKIAAIIAQRLRSIVITSTVPKKSGELSRSIHITNKSDGSIISTNKKYARRAHEGSPAITIRPRKKKALAWKTGRHPVKKVVQPPRKGNPFFKHAITRFINNKDRELQIIFPQLGTDIRKMLATSLKAQGFKITK
jgi:hypothetical protein